MLGSMPWCSFPWHKLLPRLAQNGCTVQIWSMSLHPCFRRMWFMQVCLGKPSHGSIPLLTSVFFCGWASNSQDSPKTSPRATFKWKNLDIKNFIEPLKLLSQWMTGGESWMTPCTNMCPYVPACANIAVCQLCRERQPLVEQSWWAWTENAWINAMVFVPMAQAPPKAGSKNCCINLIDEFTSWVSPKAAIAGSLRKAFLQKHAFVDISVFPPLGKQQPRFAQGQPTGYFQMKKLDIKNFVEPLKLLSQWMTGGESWMTPCTKMRPYVPACANIAVCQLCRERQPWNSHDGPEMPWCSFPWQKLLPRLAQNCCTI